MFFPTSSRRSRVSIMILRGESFLPVMFAGQDEVHLPHSVQVYASNNCFQLRSNTSLAPKRCGAASGFTGGGTKLGSSMAFTSTVTLSRLLNFPLGFKLEKKTFGNASRM